MSEPLPQKYQQVACGDPDCRFTHPELDADGSFAASDFQRRYNTAWVYTHYGETAVNHIPGDEGAYFHLRWLLAEVDRLSKRVAELETTHAPRLCACGHSLLVHTAPEPHSCFAHGQTCTCPTYRQLPPAEAWAQLEKNIQASEAHAAEQAAAVGAEGGAS
jgi:hypothetical protein